MKRITFLFTLLVTCSVFSQTIFSVNGIDYKTISSNSVEVTGRSNGNTNVNIVIPDTVENASVVYDVTKVGGSAFANLCLCLETSSVVIGSNITSLGEYSFVDSNNIEIISLNVNPPTIDWSVFSSMSDLVVKVTNSTALTNYQNADVWGSAKSIIIDETLSNPNQQFVKDLDIVISNNQISIIGKDIKVQKLEVLNTLGSSLMNGEEGMNISNLFNGVYFLRVYTDKGIVVKKIIKKE